MTRSARKLIISLSLPALLFFLSAAKQVNGQETFGADVLPLTVSPARQEVEVKPGERVVVPIKFINPGITRISGIIKVADFLVQDNYGSPTLIEGPTLLSPRFSAASWVTLPSGQGTIMGGGTLLVQASIQVPKDANPGGKYLAVYFEPNVNQTNNTGVIKEATEPTTFRLASLVYLRVAGPITENAEVTKLTVPQFLEYGPIPVTIEIANNGDYHIRPIGVLTLTDVFGKVVDQEKIDEQNIFPNASRIYKNALASRNLFGKYKVNFVATYGEQGRVLTATVFAWVFPWRVVMAIILIIIVLILLFNHFYRRTQKAQVVLEEKLAEEEKELKDLREKVQERANQ